MTEHSDRWLQAVVERATANVADGGGPFAALVVRDDEVVADGVNRVTRDLDPTAHAEVVAIRAACQALGTHVLTGTVLVQLLRAVPAVPVGCAVGAGRRCRLRRRPGRRRRRRLRRPRVLRAVRPPARDLGPARTPGAPARRGSAVRRVAGQGRPCRLLTARPLAGACSRARGGPPASARCPAPTRSEAAVVVTGELPDLPHLPELPGRGAGADMVGRTGALLVDLHVDLQPSGWRLVDRPGMDERRARSYLAQDLDQLEEHGRRLRRAGEAPGLRAVDRGCGAAPAPGRAGALRRGRAARPGRVADRGRARARGRPAPAPAGAEPVLQLDEPTLPAVLHGAIRSTSGARSYAPVPRRRRESVLRRPDRRGRRPRGRALLRPAPAGLAAARRPAPRGSRSTSRSSRRTSTTSSATAVEDGVALLAGLVPAVPAAGQRLSDPAATVEPVRRLWHRLGLAPESLRTVVVTPTCGMAGADPGHAVRALRLAVACARQLADDPEG